jgi:hypothetical protein
LFTVVEVIAVLGPALIVGGHEKLAGISITDV